MIKKTLWNKDIKKHKKNTEIPKHMEVDILIIGGGIAGMSTLFELRGEHKKIALIDAGQIGFGITSYTTGKLTYLQGLRYSKLARIFDFSKAKLYLDSQMDAIKKVKSNVTKYNIDCNFLENDSYVFTDKESEIPSFDEEAKFFAKANVPYEIVDHISPKIPVLYGIKTPHTAVFHPLKYLYHLKDLCIKDGMEIYEYVRALTLSKVGNQYEIVTEKNTILAHTVIICTHYPFFVVPGFIPLRTHIETSFIAACEVDECEPWNAITEKGPTHSYRFYEDENHYLLYAGESYLPSNHFDTKQRMQELVKKVEEKTGKKPVYTWHTHDIMTNDTLPFIGRLNKDHPNLLIATGFYKWGMTNGVLAGMILSDIVKGKENRYQELLRPDRKINLEKIKNFFIDGYQNTKSIVKAKFELNQSFYSDQVKITYIDGKRVGIVTDSKGMEHKVSNICPHMKCNLIFNTLDKTWDCPCHGSRFTIDGDVIEGPSVYNIKIDDNQKESD